MAKSSKPANAPSGNPGQKSGGGRGNNPPAKPTTTPAPKPKGKN